MPPGNCAAVSWMRPALPRNPKLTVGASGGVERIGANLLEVAANCSRDHRAARRGVAYWNVRCCVPRLKRRYAMVITDVGT